MATLDALVLWFVVACGGDADNADGQVVSAAGVRGVLESTVALAVAICARIDAVGVVGAAVVECVGLFADDGINTEVGIVDGGGARGDVDGNADGFVRAAVVSVIVIVVAVAALVVVAMQGWWGASDIRGDVAEVEGMP